MADPSVPLLRQRTFDATPDAVSLVRGWAAEALEALGAGPTVVRDLVLVLSELASNVVQHDGGTAVTVTVDDPPGWWEVGVGGSSLPPGEPERWTMAAADEPTGRGLAIVRGLVDEVTVDPGGHTIRCRLARA